MLKFLSSLFSKKPEALSPDEADDVYYIHNGTGYFAVENIWVDDIVKVLNIANTRVLKCNKAFDLVWERRSKIGMSGNDDFRIIISDVIDNWTFIYWNCGYFEECKKIVNKLTAISPRRINYYAADSCVDGYDWIIANNGRIVREFEYCMSHIEESAGEPITKEEEQFIKHLTNEADFIFGEDVYASVVDATCDLKTERFDKSHLFVIGTIKI